MMYLTGCNGPLVRPLLDSQVLGLVNTPKSNYKIQPNWVWAADNGCFNAKTYLGDEAWIAWLKKFDAAQREGCLFATAPDVIGDSAQSLARSLPFLSMIRDLAYPVALVTQDGMQPDDVPWVEIDWLFIGGTDRHKLGGEAKVLIAAAKNHGKMVHVGRVNSQKRFLSFAALGAHSVDGTFLAFGPEKNLPKLLSWIRHDEVNETLFSVRFNV